MAAKRTENAAAQATPPAPAAPPAPGAASAGSSFRLGFFFLPREKRRALEAFYAFCRASDDLVDAPAALADPGATAARLAEWRQELERTLAGRPAEPVTRRLYEEVLARYPVRPADLRAILDGVETDLVRRRYATFAELELYCYRVAGAVGLVCVEIFGRTAEATREYAVATGTALQLTNILRDVGGDARQGRIYLPQEDLARFGYPEAQLLAGAREPAFLKLMLFEAARARIFYERAHALLPPADRRTMLPGEVMRAVYRRLLERVAASGYAPLARAVGLSRPAKLAAALRAWFSIRVLGRTP